MKHPATAARVPEGARGDVTRQRLLEAGLAIFGERGFHAVTTRELADAAQANQAAIPYHFGGKEGLYRAVAQHLAEENRAALAPLLAEVARELVPGADARAVAGVLRKLVAGLVRSFVHPDFRARAAFIVREQMQPGVGFDVLYEGYLREVHEALARVVAAATGGKASHPDTILRAHALVGAALGFLVARETLCRRLSWDDYSDERLAAVTEMVADVACASVGLAAPGGSAPRRVPSSAARARRKR